MYLRPIAILIVVCFALGTGGCESFFDSFKSKPQKKSKKGYEEVLLPGQTGSLLQRRMYVRRGPEKTKKAPAKKEKAAPKPEATPKPEASASPTPKPEEESTPTAERFR